MNSPSSPKPARSSGSAEDEAGCATCLAACRSPAWGTGLAVAKLQLPDVGFVGFAARPCRTEGAPRGGALPAPLAAFQKLSSAVQTPWGLPSTLTPHLCCFHSALNPCPVLPLGSAIVLQKTSPRCILWDCFGVEAQGLPEPCIMV